jgi:bifunctional enzyme CysN/CysC
VNANQANVFVMPGHGDVSVHADVVRQNYTVTALDRARLNDQTPVTVWLTGLPGSGKSTLADAVERRLHAMGKRTMVLDGDNVRGGLNKDLGFAPEDRQENVRRVAEVAKLLCDAGVIAIVALVSPFHEDRALARDLFEQGKFIEVWVETPPEICAERDPKGLYRRAKAGKIKNMTGVGQGYEAPVHADVHAHGNGDLGENTELVIQAILAAQ